jgi:putative membrane protein
MRTFYLVAASLAALSLGACAGDMQSADAGAPSAMSSGAMAAANAPTDAMTFINEAARSDMYEIQSSQLATTKASSQAVKDFANQMIRDHTNSTQIVMAAAQSAGMNPTPPSLDSRRAGMISQLQGASGADFDRMYLRQQLMAHQEALALHSGYAKNGDNTALRGAAAQIAPIVQQHLAHVQGMQS